MKRRFLKLFVGILTFVSSLNSKPAAAQTKQMSLIELMTNKPIGRSACLCTGGSRGFIYDAPGNRYIKPMTRKYRFTNPALYTLDESDVKNAGRNIAGLISGYPKMVYNGRGNVITAYGTYPANTIFVIDGMVMPAQRPLR